MRRQTVVTSGRAMVGNLGTQVAALLGRRIVAGDLTPGITLPTEAELCESFKVSRTTIREALKKLHGKGLIAGTTRSGTRVLPTERWNQFDSDLLTWRLESGMDQGLLQELYEIRFCFEPEACRFAAMHATDEDHARIMQAYTAMTSDKDFSPRVLEADLEFHMAIVDATHNRFFVTLGQAVKTALRVSFSLLQSGSGIPDDELALHSAIADAIVTGRGEDAAKRMRDLIALSRLNIDNRVGPQSLSRAS